MEGIIIFICEEGKFYYLDKRTNFIRIHENFARDSPSHPLGGNKFLLALGNHFFFKTKNKIEIKKIELGRIIKILRINSNIKLIFEGEEYIIIETEGICYKIFV